MNKTAIFTLLSFSLLILTYKLNAQVTGQEKLKWYTWEEAVELNKTAPRKIFVDVYTDWCGWCKKMDRETFTDPAVVDFLAKNYYPVKLNAEQKEKIVFNGQAFEYQGSEGQRGVHTLAYALLDGKMSYPSYVYLNEKFERVIISPGYKDATGIMKELKYTAEEKYLTMTWEDYQKSN